jgi:hypothetical protein
MTRLVLILPDMDRLTDCHERGGACWMLGRDGAAHYQEDVLYPFARKVQDP